MTTTVPPTLGEAEFRGAALAAPAPAPGRVLGAPGLPSAPGQISISDVNCYYGSHLAVADVSLEIPGRAVTAFIGPSGCGKSTLLRAINRMHEFIPGARAEGSITLDG
ncbi:MAG: ATP-binding cassette domain-containing protein, partial [Bifidobacteriaceae bacterium]|nr:ATP-binding cassette domain-containing protein [Bifidobacteriaceae bacterium]